MENPIQISKSLSLPMDAVTQTLACIGRKGAGKTYLASVIAEQMLSIGAQVVVLDPVGNWWGLRVAADGKRKGKDIYIAGGERGDLPILPDSGSRFARLVVEKNISIVLDVSSFRQGERKRFAADFAEEFFHLKKSQRSAVHLFVEEAQLFAPQRPGPEEARMLGAFENIIRLGRNYGIGATLITQRPQSVNKEVLSQVECLCVLQVNGTHERKALEEWVQEAGADRKLVGELPGLGRGEGFVWSPAWLRIFERVKFAQKTTFDASATPEVGKTASAGILSPVDVASLKADLQQVIEQAAKDDPKALRKRIAELERDVQSLARGLEKQPVPTSTGITEEDVARAVNSAVAEAVEKTVLQVKEHYFRQVEIGFKITPQLDIAGMFKMARKPAPVTPKLKPESQWPKPAPRNVTVIRNGASGEGLSKAERAILTVLNQCGPSSKAKVAAYSGYAVSGGGFNNSLSSLRTRGFIRGSDPIESTREGSTALGDWIPLPSGDELLHYWQSKLSKAESSILGVLSVGARLDKATVAARAGYEATGGGFNNALSRLRTLELIEGSGALALTADFAEAIRA